MTPLYFLAWRWPVFAVSYLGALGIVLLVRYWWHHRGER